MSIPRGPLDTFGMHVGFEDGRVVVAVRGDLDRAGEQEFASVLGAVVGRGHPSIVLDLADLGIMSAAGLHAITVEAGRVASSGGELVIRSAPPHVTRVLGNTGLSSLVRLEATEPSRRHLGPEGLAPVVPIRIDVSVRAMRVTGSEHATPAQQSIDRSLQLVVALAQAAVQGADGVSATLTRQGQLATVAATDQTVLDMDTDQYATREGPCVDAAINGRWFHAESLDTETRWPAFTPKAQELGIRAILSNPLRAGGRPVGALNIYSRKAVAFSAKEQALAAVFAGEASVVLRDFFLDISEEQRTERMGEALRTREVIAQALGVIMERRGVSAEDAYTQLRDFSQWDSRPLWRGAEDVIRSARRYGPAREGRGGELDA